MLTVDFRGVKRWLSWVSLERLANVAVIAAAATFISMSAGGYIQPWRSDAPSRNVPPPPIDTVLEPVSNLVIDTSSATRQSSGTAKIVLVEFSDFQCPFCARHTVATQGSLERDFIETGKVDYAFFNFPLEQIHSQALRASEAAECAGRHAKFRDMRERLFANQQALSNEDLLEHARSLELPLDEFEACMAGQALPRIRQQMTEARRAGVDSTPIFLVGRVEPQGVRVMYRIRGSQPYEVFAEAFKRASAAEKADIDGAADS